MRQIKFRSWDGRSMNVPDNIANDVDGDHYEIMQFTGLKDNLGAGVYEGDIVAIYPLEQENHATVEQTSFGWCFRQADGTETTYLSPELFRVIGNVYENSDLLTAPKQKES